MKVAKPRLKIGRFFPARAKSCNMKGALWYGTGRIQRASTGGKAEPEATKNALIIKLMNLQSDLRSKLRKFRHTLNQSSIMELSLTEQTTHESALTDVSDEEVDSEDAQSDISKIEKRSGTRYAECFKWNVYFFGKSGECLKEFLERVEESRCARGSLVLLCLGGHTNFSVRTR